MMKDNKKRYGKKSSKPKQEEKKHYVLEVHDSVLGQVTITGKENEDGKSSS
jgi:hypothetical protein